MANLMNDDSHPLSLHVGQLDGRLTSLEDRADRFEGVVSGSLTTINGKLDNLASSLSVKMGERAGVGTLLKIAVGAITFLSGWIAAFGHVTLH